MAALSLHREDQQVERPNTVANSRTGISPRYGLYRHVGARMESYSPCDCYRKGYGSHAHARASS